MSRCSKMITCQFRGETDSAGKTKAEIGVMCDSSARSLSLSLSLCEMIADLLIDLAEEEIGESNETTIIAMTSATRLCSTLSDVRETTSETARRRLRDSAIRFGSARLGSSRIGIWRFALTVGRYLWSSSRRASRSAPGRTRSVLPRFPSIPPMYLTRCFSIRSASCPRTS